MLHAAQIENQRKPFRHKIFFTKSYLSSVVIRRKYLAQTAHSAVCYFTLL